MLNTDYVLSEDEISYLGIILSQKYVKGDFSSFNLKWEKLEMIAYEVNANVVEALRIKGILEKKTIEMPKVVIMEEDSIISMEEIEVGLIVPEELVKYWIGTLYYKAGKDLENIIESLKANDKNFELSIQINSNRNYKLIFLTRKVEEAFFIQNNIDTLFISFIGELPLEDFSFIYWDEPLNDSGVAERFFSIIEEKIKRRDSDLYAYLNIPPFLDAPQKEAVIKLVRNFLLKEGYSRRNQPQFLYPECSDYLFTELLIHDCFIKGDEKIFIVINNHRIEMHFFKNQIKFSDDELANQLNFIQDFIDNKAESYNKLSNRSKAKLTTDLLKIVPIIVTILLSIFASTKILFSNNQTIVNLTSTKFWLWTHVSISFIAILTLVFIGILPHFLLWNFKWERGLKRFLKKSNKL